MGHQLETRSSGNGRAWDALTLEEIRALIQQTKEALPYLHGRLRSVGTLPSSDAALTLHRLMGYEHALTEPERLGQRKSA